jgi:hypothetical protein
MKFRWHGLSWDEVKRELEGLDKPYAFQITYPRGKMKTWGNYRVVRLQEFEDRVDVILAHEMFSRL